MGAIKESSHLKDNYKAASNSIFQVSDHLNIYHCHSSPFSPIYFMFFAALKYALQIIYPYYILQ